jgi:predicted phosphoribosyltransferase
MAFLDRRDAGRRLAAMLGDLATQRPVVAGMARGGVPVAHEIARALGAPVDVIVVRKLGHPSQPELGLGAIGESGVRLVNRTLVDQLRVPEEVIDAVAAREAGELERRLRVYRGNRPPVAVEGRVVIVVDDGLATGFTARAAVQVMRKRGASRVVLAVPVGPPAAVTALREVADDVVCAETTERFFGISEWYVDFHQVSDDEVAALLADLSSPGSPLSPAGDAATVPEHMPTASVDGPPVPVDGPPVPVDGPPVPVDGPRVPVDGPRVPEDGRATPPTPP